MYEEPNSINTIAYSSSSAGKSVVGYPAFPPSHLNIPTYIKVPKSAFSLFANANNPFNKRKLVPLYRLSFSDICAKRRFQYTTQKSNIESFTNEDWCPGPIAPGIQSYRLDGIMGYIFHNGEDPKHTSKEPKCPEGMLCNDINNKTTKSHALQCLHRRYNPAKDDWALIIESELSNSEYYGYTGTLKDVSCIGYVFPNVDTDHDGVINGQELLLGTNLEIEDSDCDGIYDGREYPLADLPRSDPMDASCP